MPKMNMIISNGNLPPNPIFSQLTFNAQTLNVTKSSQPSPPSSALNSSMVGRIHSIKPGCGSCGRSR